MNTLPAEFSVEFSVASVASSTMFGADEAEASERDLLAHLEGLPPGGLLVVDFGGARVASEAARQLLRRALLRVGSGEHQDRFLILAGLERCRYSVDAMLRREQITAVERTAAGPRLIGKEDRVAAETFDFVVSQPEVTAKLVSEHFGLANIAAATNRLNALAKAALVRRAGPRSLPSGGREYVFSAVR